MAFIASGERVARSSSARPRGTRSPGPRCGTARPNSASVRVATSSTPACSGSSVPDTTMFGLSTIPLEQRPLVAKLREDLAERAPRSPLRARRSHGRRPSAPRAQRSARCRPPGKARRSGRERERSPGGSNGSAARRRSRSPRATSRSARRAPWYSVEAFTQAVEALGDLLAAAPASGFAPVSTLMPGIMPRAASSSGKGVPSEAAWRIVSS